MVFDSEPSVMVPSLKRCVFEKVIFDII